MRRMPYVPVQSLLISSQQGYASFEFLKRYPLGTGEGAISGQGILINSFEAKVIIPAEQKRTYLRWPKSYRRIPMAKPQVIKFLIRDDLDSSPFFSDCHPDFSSKRDDELGQMRQ